MIVQSPDASAKGHVVPRRLGRVRGELFDLPVFDVGMDDTPAAAVVAARGVDDLRFVLLVHTVHLPVVSIAQAAQIGGLRRFDSVYLIPSALTMKKIPRAEAQGIFCTDHARRAVSQ